MRPVRHTLVVLASTVALSWVLGGAVPTALAQQEPNKRSQSPRAQQQEARAKERAERAAQSPRGQRATQRAQQKTVPYFRDADHRIITPMRSWKALKEEYVVMQRYDYSCGAACLATVIKYFWGDEVTEEQFLRTVLETLTPEELEDRVKNGLSMTDLRRAAVANGYLASMGRRSLAQLAEAKIPVILRIKVRETDHFVVYRGIADDRVFLADPIRGKIRLPFEEFAGQWTDGVILVIVKKGAAPPLDSPLLRLPPSPVQHEMQAARSVFFRPLFAAPRMPPR